MTSPALPDPPAAPSGISIRRVAIRNFRCIDDLQLELEPGTTYLVGENNAGKTSILLALWSALGNRRPVDDDLRRTPDDSAVGDAVVDVFLVPPRGQRFATELRQRLVYVQRDPSKGTEVVGIRTVFHPSREGAALSTRRSFLQPGADGNWTPVNAPRMPQDLMARLEAHLLDASRDLVDERGNRTSIWGRVLADLQIEQHPEQGVGREALEQDLADLARRVRDSSPVLRTLQSDLGGIAEAQASVGRVEVQPLPPRLEELARTAEVVLHQPRQPVLPLRQHGLGSRSLATLLVFQTLAKLRLGADRGFQPQLLTLLEEPEAHLHPQAVFALRGLLDRLPGQRIVSTHSSQLVADADPRSVRLIRRSANSIRVLALPPDTAKRVLQFRRLVERPFGEIIFARALVLCDGSTDRYVLPTLLSGYFRCNPAGLGISFVDCGPMNQPHTMSIIRAAHDLELPWLAFTDRDPAGIRALRSLINPATGKPLEPDSDEVVMSGGKQVEQLLIDAGYTEEVEQVADQEGIPLGTGDRRHLKFLADNKPWASEQVAIRAREADKPLPEPVIVLARKLERLPGVPSEARG
ncbi:MAG: AAA family ATPase [Gammaproteobacteria bacterium]|nr:AAA family ATPase [Gammaproteobacteria bacterium]